MLFDTSGSMTKLADGPTGSPTRQDKVLALLENKGRWLDPLLANGVVDFHRFGRFLDENGLRLGKDGVRSLEEIARMEADRRKSDEARLALEEARLTGRSSISAADTANTPQAVSTSASRPIHSALWQSWLKPGSDATPPPEWDEAGREWLASLIRDGKARVLADEFNGTNPADSSMVIGGNPVQMRVGTPLFGLKHKIWLASIHDDLLINTSLVNVSRLHVSLGVNDGHTEPINAISRSHERKSVLTRLDATM